MSKERKGSDPRLLHPRHHLPRQIPEPLLSLDQLPSLPSNLYDWPRKPQHLLSPSPSLKEMGGLKPPPLTATAKDSVPMDSQSCKTPIIQKVCPPLPGRPVAQDLMRKFNSDLPPEVDEIVSLFKNEKGPRQPPNLDRDQAQEYANTLNAVGIPYITLVLRLI